MASLSNVIVATWFLFAVLFIGFAAPTEETQSCRTIRQKRSCYVELYDEFVVCDGGLEVDAKSDVNWNVFERMHHLGNKSPFPSNTGLPVDIPLDTKMLILTKYRFYRLTRENFRKLKNLQCLIIEDSEINVIDTDAFADLVELQNLEIQNTRLSTYDQLAFITHPGFRAHIVSASGSTAVGGLNFNGTDTLSGIRILRLSGNAINSMNPSILNQLVNLELLDLAHNHLEQLDWSSLRNLKKLTNLYVDDNKLQTIPEGVVRTVAEIGLVNNSFHCNCNLKWLTETTSISSIDKYGELECATPVKKRVVDMSPEEFVCTAPHKPTITWRKHGDSEYLVRCASVGDPPPKLALTSSDVRIADFPASRDVAGGNTTSHEILVSPGNYSCVAENSYGISHNVTTIPSKQEQEDNSTGNRLNPKLFIFLIAIITCIHL